VKGKRVLRGKKKKRAFMWDLVKEKRTSSSEKKKRYGFSHFFHQKKEKERRNRRCSRPQGRPHKSGFLLADEKQSSLPSCGEKKGERKSCHVHDFERKKERLPLSAHFPRKEGPLHPKSSSKKSAFSYLKRPKGGRESSPVRRPSSRGGKKGKADNPLNLLREKKGTGL